MIAFLKGILESKIDHGCLVDVNGVGYEVTLTIPDLENLPLSGEPVSLYTCLVKREEEDRLFGFLHASDRKLFKLLIAVSNVGPKMAMAVMSGLTQVQLEQVVAGQDVDSLVKVPGIGRKTAERLLLELKDKLDLTPISINATLPAERGEYAEALEALLVLGYSRIQARNGLQKVVDQELPKKNPGQDYVAELVRRALKYL